MKLERRAVKGDGWKSKICREAIALELEASFETRKGVGSGKAERRWRGQQIHLIPGRWLVRKQKIPLENRLKLGRLDRTRLGRWA